MGGLSIVACLWTLDDVITALVTSRIVIQFIAQIFALVYLRRTQPEMPRPFKMWLYPLPGADRVCGLGVPVPDLGLEIRRIRRIDTGGRSWGILDLDSK